MKKEFQSKPSVWTGLAKIHRILAGFGWGLHGKNPTDFAGTMFPFLEDLVQNRKRFWGPIKREHRKAKIGRVNFGGIFEVGTPRFRLSAKPWRAPAGARGFVGRLLLVRLRRSPSARWRTRRSALP